MSDAVVIGAGPNGLVAANLLAEAGWDVVVLEEQPEPGGAVRSDQGVREGFVHDRFSAFYPLAVASPVIRRLELESHGLEWVTADGVVAHPDAEGRCALISTDLDRTAASLDGFAPGDGDAWRRLYGLWERFGGDLIDALMTPFPPIAPGARLVSKLGARGLPRFLRFGLLPVRRLAEEVFRGEGGGWLLAGNALHADLTPDSAGGGLYGWVLCGIGQQLGFPVPRGGAGELTAALVRRLRSLGGELICGAAATGIEVRRGRAAGVATRDGRSFPARRAVIADVGAPALYRRLLPPGAVPAAVLRDMGGFQYDNSTVKVDWALEAPIPWTAPEARTAGTVHVAEGMDGLSRTAGQLARGLIPDRPFLVLGQYSMVDPSRCPPGAETAWAYTHTPQRAKGDAAGEISGEWGEREKERICARMEMEVERLAPGFRDSILERRVMGPPDLEAADANLVRGALNGGTAQVHQQVIFRPFPGAAGPRTPVRRLYLGSASAHPGGGVHGAPGANAARAALVSAGRPLTAHRLGG